MSAVSAFFVSSVPNSHRGSRDLDLWGHRSIAAILRKHAASEEWPLIVQCSSIGSLGANDDVWFRWGSLEKMFYKMTHVLQQEFIVMSEILQRRVCKKPHGPARSKSRQDPICEDDLPIQGFMTILIYRSLSLCIVCRSLLQ